MDIRRFFTLRPKDETSASLRAAQRNAERELQQAAQLQAQLEASHGEVLLGGSAEAVEALEAQLQDARAAQTSLAAMITALAPRIAAAEGREAEAELDRMEAETKAKADKARQMLPEIFTLMEQLADRVEKHDHLVRDVIDAGTLLRVAGRERVRPPLPDYWARQIPEGVAGAPYHNRFGPYLTLPGPRAGHQDLKVWRAEIQRAQTPVEDRQAAD